MARRSDACFQEVIIDNLEDAALAVDKTGKIKLFNSRAAVLFSVKPSDVIGEKVWDVIKFQELNKLIMEVARSLTPTKIEKVVIIGQKLPFLIKIFPAVQSDGKIFGVALTLRDLGEYARIEEALNNYVDNISHELKAPLTAIKGYVETLLEESYFSNPEVSKKFLQIINDETNRMTRLIISLLDRSKTQQNAGAVPLASVSPSKIITQALNLFVKVAKQKNINFEVDVPEDLPYMAAREDSLTQVFINILDNAVKFTGIKKEGRIRIIGIVEGRDVKITVSDTGIGIAKHHLPFIFDRFYRVTEGEASALGGTGLGLSITKELIEDMGGRVDITSELNCGTKVTVILRMAK